MLDATWGGVAVYRGREMELHAMPGSSGTTTEAGADWLISSARASQNDVETRAIPKEIAAGMPFPEEPGTVVFVRIAASDNERLGTLCLIRNRKTLGADEKRLLHALASHAALSLENFGDSRNWSGPNGNGWKTSTRSAITSWCTTARGKSFERTLTCVPPWRAASGPGRRGHEQSEADRGNRKRSSLPFCRDTQRSKEEYVAASAERIFLVSTSRTPGVSDDDTRTIHVLKDITDRREAERRYRELFDSIQEGLFFATPDGRFLDVNDAMVRMLGTRRGRNCCART